VRATLGAHGFDLDQRAIVLGVVASVDEAVRFVAEGADGVEVEEPDAARLVGALRASVHVPVVVATADADTLGRACAAGATVGDAARGQPGPPYHAVAVATGATVIVADAESARAASTAGLSPEQIIVAPNTADDTASFALAISRGGRVVRTRHVRTARRTADVLAAVLAARAKAAKA
jgi:hypothetical protein